MISIVAGVLIGAFFLMIVVSIIVYEPDYDGDVASNPEVMQLSAFNVCKDFVRDRLKSPGSASFRNFFEGDGEVSVTGAGDGPFVVRSSVDSENSFGASLRTSFTCEVRRAGGDNWRLVDITLG